MAQRKSIGARLDFVEGFYRSPSQKVGEECCSARPIQIRIASTNAPTISERYPAAEISATGRISWWFWDYAQLIHSSIAGLSHLMLNDRFAMGFTSGNAGAS